MKVIRRLKKLIAHQKSAQKIGNVAEAEAFAATIQKLLDKYNLSLADVDSNEDENSPIDGDIIQSKFKAEKMWQFTLLSRIAALNGCYSLAHADKGFQIIIGRENDRQIVGELYEYFEELAVEFGQKYSDSFAQSVEFFLTPTRFQDQLLKDKTESYLYGLITKLCARLSLSHQANLKQAEQSNALVFVGDKSKQAKDWAYGNLKVSQDNRNVKLKSREAYFAGVDQGKSIALTNKVME